MTDLEREMVAEIKQTLTKKGIAINPIAAAAAEVAKRYIEKAFDAGKHYGTVPYRIMLKAPDKDQWLKENGII